MTTDTLFAVFENFNDRQDDPARHRLTTLFRPSRSAAYAKRRGPKAI